MNNKKNPDVRPSGHENYDTYSNGILPHYDEFENNILGCILTDLNSREKILTRLQNSDFYNIKNLKLFQCMLNMHKSQIPIDELTVFEELKKEGLHDETGGLTWLGQLSDNTMGPSSIDFQIQQIIEASHNREIWTKAQRLSKSIENNNREIIRQQSNELADLLNKNENLEPHDLEPLSNYQPTPINWLLKDAIPFGFPTIIYGDGGLGKSYLGLYLGTLAALGSQTFLGLEFHSEPINVLYADWELNKDEVSDRARKISCGLGLTKPPSNLFYIPVSQGLRKYLPQLRAIVNRERIRLLIIDSLGSSSVDADKFLDVVQVMNEIKNLGIASVLLDHQSKMQSQDTYDRKSPYGSVYKFNLARSVFQLSSAQYGNINNGDHSPRKLRHTKTNFGRKLDDLFFNIIFDEYKVIFCSMESSEKKDLKIIQGVMNELNSQNQRINQKTLIENLKGIVAKDKIIRLLRLEEGKLWDKSQGKGSEIIYTQILECDK